VIRTHLGSLAHVTVIKERPIWQRRFWEHMIRDEEDLNRHIMYVLYNPVKHGLGDRCSRLAVFYAPPIGIRRPKQGPNSI